MKKLLTLLLAASMPISILASCSNSDDASQSDETTTAAETTAAETTTAELTSGLPEELDFDGFEVRVVHYNNPMFMAEDGADVVEDAIVRWQQEVCEKLNIVFSPTALENGTILESSYKNAILAGSDDYNFILGEMFRVSKYVTENYFHNLLDLEYVNFDAPWWADNWMSESAVGDDKLFMAIGDISLSTLKYQSCIYYNQQVYENYFGDPKGLYNVVDEGSWTFEEFRKTASQVYADINGDSEKTVDDQLAALVHIGNVAEHLCYDSGFRSTARDADGKPYLTIDSEKNVKIIERLYDLYFNNKGIFVVDMLEARNANYVIAPTKLANDELLFFLGWFHSSELLREMEGAYGIIPFPKYDETQENYISLVHDEANVVSIPITVSEEDADIISAIMEEMAFLGWRDVTPTFYEVALKVKYMRDSDDVVMKIVDMIHDGVTTDFAYIYNYAIDNAGLLMRDLMRDESADIASYYASKEESINTKFDTLIGHFTAME